MKTLFSWLGNTDIKNMERNEHGPISLIATKSEEPFNKIVILGNTWNESWEAYKKWLIKRMGSSGRPWNDINIYQADLISPVDYTSIEVEAQKWIPRLSLESETLSINLSSGTPAMTVMSIIVGNANSNTRFFQSNRDGTINQEHISFDTNEKTKEYAARSIASRATTKPRTTDTFNGIVSHSPAMRDVINKAEKLSQMELPILILGETGTGKEVLSKAIHKASPRKNNGIITVNCGAIPESLVDSTLFGHKKGAFTGAIKDSKGLFEQAHGGTLFLDEVGELTLNTQVKLLRALQQGEITKVGGEEPKRVDVRIIAATHRDLSLMVEKGEFREDLFYRLALGIIEIPPLRSRLEDVEPLTDALVDEINNYASKYPNYEHKSLSDSALLLIKSLPWKGNVRELWSTLNRALLLSNQTQISQQDISDALIKRSSNEKPSEVQLKAGDSVNLKNITEDIERAYLKAALLATGNGKVKTAKMLGLANHQNLDTMLKRLNISVPK